jgi:hypothetical protein
MAVEPAYSAAHSPKECLVHCKLTTRHAPPRRPTLRQPVIGLLALAVLAGCTRQVAVKGDWIEGVAHQGGFANILVVGVSPDVNARCAFEQSMTANLRSDTVKATTSCAAMGTKTPLTRENVEQAVAKVGADAVVATSLVDFSAGAKEGGSADARGGGYYKATDIGYASYYGAIGGFGAYGVPVVYAEFETAPSVFSVSGTVHLSTRVFETIDAALVYALDTKAKNLQSREMALAAITPEIVASLRDEGLLR